MLELPSDAVVVPAIEEDSDATVDPGCEPDSVADAVEDAVDDRVADGADVCEFAIGAVTEAGAVIKVDAECEVEGDKVTDTDTDGDNTAELVDVNNVWAHVGVMPVVGVGVWGPGDAVAVTGEATHVQPADAKAGGISQIDALPAKAELKTSAVACLWQAPWLLKSVGNSSFTMQ